MSDTFYDSRRQVEQLLALLEHNDVVLEGARGVGKTRLALEVEKARLKQGCAAIYLMVHDATSERDLYTRIAERVQKAPQLWRSVKSFLTIGATAPSPRTAIEELFANRARPGTLWVLLDEAQDWIDALPSAERSTTFSWLAGLRDRFDLRLVVAGSVSVRTCLRRHDIVLDPRWATLTAASLPPEDGKTLFFDEVRCAVDDAGQARAFHEAGGLPRWIKRIARQVNNPNATESDVEAAVNEVIRAERFDAERRHVEQRLGDVAWRVLVAAAAEGSTLATVRADVHATRSEIDGALVALVDSHLLRDPQDVAFVLPLLVRAMRAGRVSR